MVVTPPEQFPQQSTPAVYSSASAARRRRRRRLAIGAVVAGAALGVAAGSLTAVDASAHVPYGTTVLGVDLGGKSRAEAVSALVDGVGPRLADPLTVRVGTSTTTVQPAAIGLALDADATVAKAAAATPNPLHLLGKHSVKPVVAVDSSRLSTELASAVKAGGRAMTPPKVTFSGLTPKATYPVAGQGLDEPGAVRALADGWLREPTVSLPLREVQPVTTKAGVDALVADLAKPAVAAPVTVHVGTDSFSIPRSAIAKSLVLTGDVHGQITPHVDAAKLRTAIAPQLSTVERTPTAAQVSVAGGAPSVLASTGGEVVDTAALARNLLDELPKSSDRVVTASLVTVAPKTTSSQLAALGIKEKVSSFTTYFQGGQDRNVNIIQVAKKVDGAIVKPGETFSLNGYTGERSYPQGYVDAPVILGGKLVNAVGGGISQFTTTLFNSAYYAGLQDVFHHPHSYYISRYPSVIESTIYYPTLDMKFRNDTPYGVLIDTSYTNDSITVTMWSTKQYDVKTEWGPKRDITHPKTEHLSGKGCIASVGSDGFAQDAWRIFSKNGKEIKREKFSWRYDPEPHFVCD